MTAVAALLSTAAAAAGPPPIPAPPAPVPASMSPPRGTRTEAELIAEVLDGPQPAADVLRWAEVLAQVPFWERHALSPEALSSEHGVPSHLARRLVALWELAVRLFPDERPAIACPRDAALVVAGLGETHAETVLVLLLDGRQRPLGIEVVAVGTPNVARVQPRDVFAPAIRTGATALVVAHSHPGPLAVPSRADRHMTVALREAASLMGIALLDHIVVARRTYHSFARSDGWTDTPGWTGDDRDSCY